MEAGKVDLTAKNELSWLTPQKVEADYLKKNLSDIANKLTVGHYVNMLSLHSI